MKIPRDQVVHRVEEAGWKYDDQTERVELYRKVGAGSRLRIDLPKKDWLPEPLVRTILRQAGLTREEFERFMTYCTKR